jgi:hypothetical protein
LNLAGLTGWSQAEIEARMEAGGQFFATKQVTSRRQVDDH